MGLHLCGSGQAVPADVVPALQLLDAGERVPIEALLAAHAMLCEHVHPARPSTLALLSRRGAFSDRGSTLVAVPITRHMLIIAVSALVGAVLVGMSPEISSDPAAGNPLTAGGLPYLVNHLYFMLTAALGAAFYAVTTLTAQITAGTYDPKNDAAYWTRIVLGVMAGTILSSMLEVPEGSNLHHVGRNALALLGGFSAELVNKILLRMVESVQSVFGADSPKGPARPLGSRPSRFTSIVAGAAQAGSAVRAPAADSSPVAEPSPAPAPSPAPDPSPPPLGATQ